MPKEAFVQVEPSPTNEVGVKHYNFGKVFRAEEAADALGISRSSLFELVRRGELASFKVGASRRIPGSAIEAFIAARLVGGQS